MKINFKMANKTELKYLDEGDTFLLESRLFMVLDEGDAVVDLSNGMTYNTYDFTDGRSTLVEKVECEINIL